MLLTQVPRRSSNLREALSVLTQKCPTGSPGASFKIFSLLTLRRVIPRMFLKDSVVRIIEDSWSPVLDTTHFALASSPLLRGTDLLDIIPGLKFLKKQNSLLGFPVAFSFIFDHQNKFRNFFNLMTFGHDQRW